MFCGDARLAAVLRDGVSRERMLVPPLPARLLASGLAFLLIRTSLASLVFSTFSPCVSRIIMTISTSGGCA